MEPKLSKVLDECITRVSKRRSIKSCLAEYPAMSRQLEPLLNTASSVVAIPRVSPSDEFRKMLKARLGVRLSEDRAHAKAARPGRTALTVLSEAWQGLVHTIATSRRVAIPVAVTLLLVLASALSIFWTSSSTSSPVTLTSKCTLSILSGSVEWQNSGSAVWEKAPDGLTLEAGNLVRTDASSEALLTFFEGSTLKLGANTEVEIQRAEYTEGEHTNITLRQWFGKTWSRVVHMVDPGSHYEIQTPAASAIVRGTFFMTEVEESGSTIVQTFEGLVTVSVQTAPPSASTTATTVSVPANFETRVEFGGIPSQPTVFEPPAQVPDEQDSQDQNSEEQDSQGQGNQGQGNQGQGNQGQGNQGQGNQGQGNQGQGNQGQGNQGQGPGWQDRGWHYGGGHGGGR